MIKSIWIDNFKSLVDFKLELAHFTCLVGLNGAGKSTVLQALDFISQLMIGDLEGWLRQRQWSKTDIASKLITKETINFKVLLIDELYGDLFWGGTIDLKSLNCTSEYIDSSFARDTLRILEVKNGTLIIRRSDEDEGAGTPIIFEYQGSILSSLKDSQLDPDPRLKFLKQSIKQIHSLDLLSPELLRTKTRQADGRLGLGGEKLSAFIHELGLQGKDRLKEQLEEVYQQLKSIETHSTATGWKQLEIVENFNGRNIKTTARHINDGMLRLMAVLSQLDSAQRFLLFDEIENGINPELVEFLVDYLVYADNQIMVTTHSPMILNFLEDDTAQEGVVYLYKNQAGYTRAIRLFAIPSLKKKLTFMGPGEAFIDTDLIHLEEEISKQQ